MNAQGSQAHAKEDTVFLGLTTITTDLSQIGTDLTVSGGGGYETSSTRVQLTTRREVYVRGELTALDTSTAMAVHGNTALTDATWAIGTEGTAKIVLYQNGAPIWTAPFTCDGSDYSIAWSTRPNPDTTGAGDAQISEVMIYNHTTLALLVLEQFTHATPTTNAAWNFSVGGWWNGATLALSPATAPTKVRVSKAFHPHVETLQEFVSARSTHTTTFAQATEPLGLATLYAGTTAEFAGQANAGFLAAHARELRPRLLSPMINEVYRSPRTFTSTPTPANWFRNVTGANPYQIDATTLRWVPVPAVSYALVRLHVKTWVLAGAAVPVGFRCYIINDDNTFGGFVSAKLVIDHGAGGVGQWINLGVLTLPNTTHVRLALAHAVDPNSTSANDTNSRYQIRAWQVRPVFGEYP